MMKIFALLSILLFAFKAVFAQSPTVSVDNFKSNQRREELLMEQAEKCNTDGSALTPQDKTRCKALPNIIRGYSNSSSEEGSDTKLCADNYNKYSTSKREFNKDQKNDAREAKKDAESAKKTADEAQESCSKDINELNEKITEENKKLQPALLAIEEEIKKLSGEKDAELQKLLKATKDLAAAITRNENTERDALKLKYDTDVEQLTLKCELDMVKARDEAKAYLEGRRMSRNSGRTKFRGVNTNSNSNPDEIEAQKIVDRAYNACMRAEKIILDNAILAEKTLNETLAQMRSDQLDLMGNLEKLQNEISKLPSEKIQKQNAKISEITQAVEALQKQVGAKQLECAQKLTSLKKEAEAAKKEAKSDRDATSGVLEDFNRAFAACCDDTGKPKAATGGDRSFCSSASSVKKQLGGRH